MASITVENTISGVFCLQQKLTMATCLTSREEGKHGYGKTPHSILCTIFTEWWLTGINLPEIKQTLRKIIKNSSPLLWLMCKYKTALTGCCSSGWRPSLVSGIARRRIFCQNLLHSPNLGQRTKGHRHAYSGWRAHGDRYRSDFAMEADKLLAQGNVFWVRWHSSGWMLAKRCSREVPYTFVWALIMLEPFAGS